MGTFNTSWKELRTSVKNYLFTECPRNNKEKLPIFFDRNENSLSNVKFFVVSQEPAAYLRREYQSSNEIEEYAIYECGSNPNPNRVGIPHKIREIFNKRFDLKTDEIYWTHALKCVPMKEDTDIIKEWRMCAFWCVNHFKNELNLIPSKQLIIVAIGNYALTLCKHILEGEKLSHTEGIIQYIRNIDLEKKFHLGEKEISLFPFIHPSKREMILKQYDRNDEVKKKEKKIIDRIRQFKQ